MNCSILHRSIIVLILSLNLIGCGGGGGSSTSPGSSGNSNTLSSAPILTIEGTYNTSGQSRDAIKDGDYIYIADGAAGLTVLQEYQGYTLSKIGSLAIVGGSDRAFSLVKNGNYIYMAARAGGIYVINVSTPSSPSLVTRVTMPDTTSFVLIYQNMLYATVGTYFVILDISNPASPYITGQLAVSTAPTQNLIIDDNKAYIAAYNKGLLILDVSNSSSPSIISETTISQSYTMRGIAKTGNYVYIGGGATGLFIYDVSNPIYPALIKQVLLPNEDGLSPYKILIWGNFLFIADGNSGIHVMDITDPTNPVLVDSIDTPGSSRSLTVDDLTAVVADYNSGVQLLNIFETTDIDGDGVLDGNDAFKNDASEWLDSDIDGIGNNADPDDDNDGYADINDAFPLDSTEWADSDNDGTGDNSDLFPTDSSEWADADVDGIGDNADGVDSPTLTLVKYYDTPGQVRGTLKDGDIIYVSDGDKGLLIFQIAANGDLTEVGAYPLAAGGHVRYFAKVGNYLYMACRSEGLLVLDVTDNTNPQLVYTYDTPDMATFITVVDSTLYLSDRQSLVIFDISTPQSPVWQGTYPAPNEFEHVYVADDIAFIAAYYSGIYVLDVSDPTDPTFINSTSTNPDYGAMWAIEKQGNYLFAGGETSGLVVLDIQNPYRPDPVIVASLALPDGALGGQDRPPFHMKVQGDYLFVADGLSGIQIVNISNPLSPFIAADFDTPGYLLDFYLDGYTMTIGDYWNGFRVLNLGTNLDHDGDGTPNYIDEFPLIPFIP